MRGEMRGKYLSCSVSYKMNILPGRVGGRTQLGEVKSQGSPASVEAPVPTACQTYIGSDVGM